MNDLYEDELAMEMDGFEYEDELEVFEDLEMEAESDWEGDYMDMEGGSLEDTILEMEMLAEAASEAETEEEADEFLGLLGGLATSLLPKAISLGRKFLPKIARGVAGFFRKKLHSPTGRKMIKMAPQVLRNVARGAARRYGQGRPITPGWLLKNVANQTYRAARNPHIAQRALRNHHRYVQRSRHHPRFRWGPYYSRTYSTMPRRYISQRYASPASVH